MPLDYGSRNLVSGNNSPYIPLVTDNPAFKVAIIPVDGRFEEKPNAKDGTEEIESIKIGDTIRGEISSQTNKRGKRVLGHVIQIEQENNNITAYKVITRDGENCFIDPSTATKIDVRPDSGLGGYNPNPVVESRNVLLYEEWKFENRR